jgi:2-dehydro-3-deoxyphosphogluconate aldolase/(4S)-4-hydroxy-2-oxoglutarate aldolase
MTAASSSVRSILERERVLPVVVLDDASSAVALGAAVRAGGLSTIEVTLRTPAAKDAIAALAAEGDLIVGAGTVLTRDHAAMAIDAGAQFIVSPGVSAAVINGGLPAVKALSAPFGDLKFVPTGGISADTLAAYLAHPAVLAVGGSWIVARPLIAASDWPAITALVAAAVAIAEGVGAHG